MEQNIDFVPISLACSSLGISDRELRRDRQLLRKKLKGDFRDYRYGKGLSGDCYRVICHFRNLAKVMGKKAALDHLRIHGVDL